MQSDRTQACVRSPSPGLPSVMNGSSTGQCIVTILGIEVNTASFTMYTFALSTFFQTVLVITMSGAADHGQYRKTLLLAFAFLGATSTMLFLPVTSNVYLLGSLLAIIGNICFGASFVLLNSFLPLLVRWHPTTRAIRAQQDSTEDIISQEEVCCPCNKTADGLRDRSGDGLMSRRILYQGPHTTILKQWLSLHLSSSMPLSHRHTRHLQRHLRPSSSYPQRSRPTALALAIWPLYSFRLSLSVLW